MTGAAGMPSREHSDALDRVGIAEFAGRRASNLSGGAPFKDDAIRGGEIVGVRVEFLDHAAHGALEQLGTRMITVPLLVDIEAVEAKICAQVDDPQAGRQQP